MAPIRIYTDAPITAAKADGVTPQTAQAPTPTSSDSRYVPITTSAIGGPPQYVSPRTTHTSRENQDPPQPQPGAVPTLPTHTHSSGPPLPQPSLTSGPTTIVTATATPTTMPPQMSIPAPTTNNYPTATKSTSYTPPSPTTTRGPTTINLGPVAPTPTSQYSIAETQHQPRQSLEHPPGYVQNPYAAELSAAQRASLEAAEREERRPSRTSISDFLGVGGEREAFAQPQGAGASVWQAVKGFANTAALKAQELEEAAWKMANKKS